MPLVGFGYRTTLVIGEGFSPLRQQIWDFGDVRRDAPMLRRFSACGKAVHREQDKPAPDAVAK